MYGEEIAEARTPDCSAGAASDHESSCSITSISSTQGGNAQLVNLPKIGIKSYASPDDRFERLQLADELAIFLKEKGLDARP